MKQTIFITVSEYGSLFCSNHEPSQEHIGSVTIGTVEIEIPDYDESACAAAARASRNKMEIDTARKKLEELERCA